MPRNRKSQVTMTFALTFKPDPHKNIPEIRAAIKQALRESGAVCPDHLEDADMKLHLTNKEISYA